MRTIFDVIVFTGLLLGAIFGAQLGVKQFGVIGGIVGAIIGGFIGIFIGKIISGIPNRMVWRSLARYLGKMSNSELRVYLHDPECLTPNGALLELKRRGEDIQSEIPLVLDLLEAKEQYRRGRGWAALTSAFPELATQIRNYSIGDSTENCRKKTETLRNVL